VHHQWTQEKGSKKNSAAVWGRDTSKLHSAKRKKKGWEKGHLIFTLTREEIGRKKRFSGHVLTFRNGHRGGDGRKEIQGARNFLE